LDRTEHLVFIGYESLNRTVWHGSWERKLGIGQACTDPACHSHIFFFILHLGLNSIICCFWLLDILEVALEDCRRYRNDAENRIAGRPMASVEDHCVRS
jgi:hypothetical protein